MALGAVGISSCKRVLFFAFGDSDILAFAQDGQGGNITLATPVFLGDGFSASPADVDPTTLDGNGLVNINASGAISSGVITLPDVSFIEQGLTDLPTNLIDTASLIANSCIDRTRDQRGNFIVTGAGGLPIRPGGATSRSSFPTGTVQTVPSASATNRPWQMGDPIVEPQGVYRLPNGKLVMSRDCASR